MNFWKNSKRLQWNTWGPGGHWFMKKTWSRKSRVRLAMSNQRSFKIESFRFPASVPKKIEYIRFWNKILDRSKTFSISTRKFRFKRFCSGPFSNFFETRKSFVWSLKNPGQVWNVFVSFCYNFLKIQTFSFDSLAVWSKQKRSEFVPIISGPNQNVLVLFR